MFIHIIQDEKFTEEFINFINRNYIENDHLIYVYKTGEEFVSTKLPNVIYIDYRWFDLKRINEKLELADKIFVHGFYNIKIMFWLMVHKSVLWKTVLIIWGADLYNARYAIKNKDQKGLNITNHVCEILKKRIMQEAKMYMTFACADFDLAAKWYGAKGIQFDCLYPSNADKELLDGLDNKPHSGRINILVGNSATKTNKHKQILEMLKKYLDKDICIYCPLSYGGYPQYADEIAKYGKEIFGEKFIAIRDYMTPKEYSAFLNNMDIAIFNNNRQQGTGNIEILAYLGKKIYIRSDTTMWEHYVKRDKCSFYSVESIENKDFVEFCLFDDAERESNKTYFSKIWNESYVKSLWDRVFEYDIRNQ